MLSNAFTGISAIDFALPVFGSPRVISKPSGSKVAINFALIESAPSPPHDLDITIDYDLGSYNLAYNTSWVITTRNGTHSPKWVHVATFSRVIP